MDSKLPSDIRSTLRLAVAAVIVGLAIPLLPVFGEGGRGPFIFSQGLGARFLIVYLLRYWASAVVAMVGIWFLKRDRAGPAGGVFLALGLVVAIGTAGDVLVTAPHFGRWQTDPDLGARDRGSDPSDARGIACTRGGQRGPDRWIAAARITIPDRLTPRSLYTARPSPRPRPRASGRR
jgi:hypothetical protein